MSVEFCRCGAPRTNHPLRHPFVAVTPLRPTDPAPSNALSPSEEIRELRAKLQAAKVIGRSALNLAANVGLSLTPGTVELFGKRAEELSKDLEAL